MSRAWWTAACTGVHCARSTGRWRTASQIMLQCQWLLSTLPLFKRWTLPLKTRILLHPLEMAPPWRCKLCKIQHTTCSRISSWEGFFFRCWFPCYKQIGFTFSLLSLMPACIKIVNVSEILTARKAPFLSDSSSLRGVFWGNNIRYTNLNQDCFIVKVIAFCMLKQILIPPLTAWVFVEGIKL